MKHTDTPDPSWQMDEGLSAGIVCKPCQEHRHRMCDDPEHCMCPRAIAERFTEPK